VSDEIELLLIGVHDRPVALNPAARSDACIKAQPILVDKAMTVADGLQAIVTACLCHFHLNAPFVIERQSPKALHQARVALRRLRSAFALFRPAIEDAELERIKGEIRWLMRLLGQARNLDVYLRRNLTEEERCQIQERRQAAYDDVVTAMDSRRVRRLMADLIAWSMLGEWRCNRSATGSLRPFADRRVGKTWTKVARTRHLAALGERQRHHFRIRVKKLRYALDFTQALHRKKPERQRKFREATRCLQQSLGHLNDLAVARSIAGDDEPPPIVRGKPSADDERAQLGVAQDALRRLRKIGPYWGR
jgi:CHAD domain-containing protein